MSSLKEIQKIPTTTEKIHESCFRSYHILNKVLEMIKRGDSEETIMEVVELLRSESLETDLASFPEQTKAKV